MPHAVTDALSFREKLEGEQDVQNDIENDEIDAQMMHVVTKSDLWEWCSCIFRLVQLKFIYVFVSFWGHGWLKLEWDKQRYARQKYKAQTKN